MIRRHPEKAALIKSEVFRMKHLLKILFAAAIVFSVSVPFARAYEDSLQQELETELRKMIDAGHLRPGYFVCVEFYVRDTRSKVFDYGHHYFSNPAETIYTLLRALPLVENNTSLHTDLRAYIQSEWNAFPPTQYTHIGFNSGAGREGTKFAAEVLSAYRLDSQTGQGTPQTGSHGFPGWDFNPFNFYACWIYAKEFGGKLSIYNAVKDKKELVLYPSDSLLQAMPHVLNSYIAGYIGFLKLEELAGQPKTTGVETRLNELKAKLLTNLATHARGISATEAGGFLYLVPELGDYLYRNGYNLVENRVEQHSLLCPYWMQAFAGETTRYTGGTKMCEGTTSHLYEYSSMFQAKAMILKESRTELELDLDVPRFERGDLYYIQNLIATLEAGPPLSASIPAANGRRCPE